MKLGKTTILTYNDWLTDQFETPKERQILDFKQATYTQNDYVSTLGTNNSNVYGLITTFFYLDETVIT